MCVGTKARVPRAAHGAVGCALTLAWCAVTLCCQALVCDSDSGYQVLFVVTRCGAHHLEVLLNGQVSSVNRDVHALAMWPCSHRFSVRCVAVCTALSTPARARVPSPVYSPLL